MSVLVLLSVCLTAACASPAADKALNAVDDRGDSGESGESAAFDKGDTANISPDSADSSSRDFVSPDAAAAADISHDAASPDAAAGDYDKETALIEAASVTSSTDTALPGAADAGSGSSSSGVTAEAALSAEQSAEQSGDEPRMLKYIDAWQEWHTMEVDPGVAGTVYSPENFFEKDGQMQLEDDRFEVLQGVDVSEHQGYIDWEAVAQAGYRFAFIRVGYRGYGEAGVLAEDARAVENLQGAKAAGLQTGTYFFSQALNEEEAREEAALAVSVISRSGVSTDLPLMYDPELIRDDWGRANEITREQVSLNTAAFKEAVLEASPLSVDIYSNLPWEHHYFDRDTLNQYSIWYADYEKSPQTPYHFTWWQYTNEGSVPGISGLVDLNLWIKEKQEPAADR